MRLAFSKGIIREWCASDRPRLVKLADNKNIWRNMADRFPHPYTTADADDWFAYLASQRTPTHWAIEIDGRAAGAAGIEIQAGMYRHSATFGYWLGEPYWGRGIATAVVRALAPALFGRFDLVRLEARVFHWNPASARVLDKAGFSHEGVLRCSAIKDGRYVDQLVYALLDEETSRERRPATVHEMRSEPGG